MCFGHTGCWLLDRAYRGPAAGLLTSHCPEHRLLAASFQAPRGPCRAVYPPCSLSSSAQSQPGPCPPRSALGEPTGCASQPASLGFLLLPPLPTTGPPSLPWRRSVFSSAHTGPWVPRSWAWGTGWGEALGIQGPGARHPPAPPLPAPCAHAGLSPSSQHAWQLLL